MNKTHLNPEIKGFLALRWGDIFIPNRGSQLIVRVKGDLLEASTSHATNREVVWTRIQGVNSVEISRQSSYLILATGIILVLLGLGLLGGTSGDGSVIAALLIAIGIGFGVSGWMNKHWLIAMRILISMAGLVIAWQGISLASLSTMYYRLDSEDTSEMGLLVLTLGIFFATFGWLNKNRLMIIRTLNSAIPIFMDKPSEDYERFGLALLSMARQLRNQASKAEASRSK